MSGSEPQRSLAHLAAMQFVAGGCAGNYDC